MWSNIEDGSIMCGPGSYYTDDSSITEIHRDITTWIDAHNFVNEDGNERNDIVMWQLCEDEGGPAHLVFHRRRFLSQNLDATTGMPIDAFAEAIASFQKGKQFGKPITFLTGATAKETRNLIKKEV